MIEKIFYVMTTFYLLLVFVTVGIACSAAVYYLSNDFDCQKTGRIVSGTRLIGKVMLPYTEEEVICKSIKK